MVADTDTGEAAEAGVPGAVLGQAADFISQGVCKTVKTTLLFIIVLQSRREGHVKAHNYGTDSGQIFRTFSPQLENNHSLKCNSDSFIHPELCGQ